MNLDESRHPLQRDAVQTCLEAQGWTGPRPVILTARTAREDASAVLGDFRSADLSSVVLEEWSGEITPFIGDDLPPGSTLAVSVLVAEPLNDKGDGWLLLAGALAAADALRFASHVNAEVAWPDGISVPGAMCGGAAGSLQVGAVRTDRVDAGVVLSVVIAVGISSRGLPARTSSVYSEGGAIDRGLILAMLLTHLARRVAQWRADDPGLPADYRERCQTLGRLVDLSEGRGHTSGVDLTGNLIVTVDGVPRVVMQHDRVRQVTGLV